MRSRAGKGKRRRTEVPVSMMAPKVPTLLTALPFTYDLPFTIQYVWLVTGAHTVLPATYRSGFIPPRNSSDAEVESLKENSGEATFPSAINCVPRPSV